MTKREHKVDVVKISARSRARRKREKIDTLEAKLDALGADGWELVPYGAVPMTGRFTNNVGYAYLSLFTRPGS